LVIYFLSRGVGPLWVCESEKMTCGMSATLT